MNFLCNSPLRDLKFCFFCENLRTLLAKICEKRLRISECGLRIIPLSQSHIHQLNSENTCHMSY